MSRQSTAQPCATGCGAMVRRRSVATPICPACMALAEAIFARTHSALDPDWLPARNRFFGKGASIVAAVQAERARQAA